MTNNAFDIAEFLLAKNCYETREFGKGTCIIQEGDPPQGVYVLLHGEVNIFKNGEKIKSLRTGQLFGEFGLISGFPRQATVLAETHVKVLYIPSLIFRGLYQKHPEIKKIVDNLKQDY